MSANHRHADLIAGGFFILVLLIELAFMGLLAYGLLRVLRILGGA